MKYNKILFMDLDGVLYAGHISGTMDKSCLDALRKILAETDVMIVITSTRRIQGGPSKMKDLFVASNAIDICPRILSLTPHMPDKNRVEEIKGWIDRNSFDGKYATVDDFDLSFGFKKGFFLTNFDLGLTDEIANQIIEYLK